MSGGRHNTLGTPQGGVISPMLANVYMNRFLKYWRRTGQSTAFQAHVVAYADDFVILTRGHAAEALAWTRRVMTRLGLTLNETKTSVRYARQERFDFLGYTFGPHYYWNGGRWYLGASPSKKSVQRLKTKFGEILVPGNHAPWPEVCTRLNSLLRGWSNYFSHGTRRAAQEAIDSHVLTRVQEFLTRRHKVPTRGTNRFPAGAVFGSLGGSPSVPGKPWRNTVGLGVKPVGKPDTGNRHVRFDERGRGNGPSSGTAPLLDSTGFGLG